MAAAVGIYLIAGKGAKTAAAGSADAPGAGPAQAVIYRTEQTDSSAFDGSQIHDSNAVETQVDEIIDVMDDENVMTLSTFLARTGTEELLEAIRED